MELFPSGGSGNHYAVRTDADPSVWLAGVVARQCGCARHLLHMACPFDGSFKGSSEQTDGEPETAQSECTTNRHLGGADSFGLNIFHIYRTAVGNCICTCIIKTDAAD